MGGTDSAYKEKVRSIWDRQGITYHGNALRLLGYAEEKAGLVVYFELNIPTDTRSNTIIQSYINRVRAGDSGTEADSALTNALKFYGQSFIKAVTDVGEPIAGRAPAAPVATLVAELIARNQSLPLNSSSKVAAIGEKSTNVTRQETAKAEGPQLPQYVTGKDRPPAPKSATEQVQREIITKANVAQPAPSAPPTQLDRLALVIGNNTYQHIAPLKAASHDAASVEKALRSAGFRVRFLSDLNLKDMLSAIRDFTEQLRGGEEVVFYFAGHGVQVSNVNYLLPVDIKAETALAIRDQSVELQRVMEDLAGSKPRLTLAIIDACRNNPIRNAGRSVSTRGLGRTDPASGQMIIFSAGSNQQALDNLGTSDKSPNGVFTRVLLAHIQRKGVPIHTLMREVKTEVRNLAKTVGHDQNPAIYDEIIGDFYLHR